MRSTPKTRKTAIDKIKLHLNSADLNDDDAQSLYDVLDILIDAIDYADFFKLIDSRIGLKKLHKIDTYKDVDDIIETHDLLMELCEIISQTAMRINTENL